jgi:signal transduction histidine kinase
MPASTRQDVRARLAQHRLLGDVPASEHAWLALHGVVRTYPAGTVVNTKGSPVPTTNIVLSGHVVIRVDRGAGAHKIFEWRAGDVGGLLPFSRGAKPPGDMVAEEDTELLEVPIADLPELIRECPAVTAKMVHAMLDRARQFNTNDHRDEKLVSLGRLAAGLAHELNNPAAAAVRSAKILAGRIATAETMAQRLGAEHLSAAQLAAVDAAREACRVVPSATLSAIQRADREDAISEWLEAHGANEQCAEPLAESGVTIGALDTLAASVTGRGLDAAVCWIAAGCAVRALASELDMAASRIHEIVGAVKSFTFMDHAPSPEPVDIRRGISDTVTMLGAKARAKSAQISIQIPTDLPRAYAVGAELNQVWMNLLDNAIDAIPANGHVVVTASQSPGRVIVHVTDDGPGIPTEILARIFDPFFTTKGVGEGTGLGLDIVRRLLQRHDGEVEVETKPGRTEFRVILPAEKLRS